MNQSELNKNLMYAESYYDIPIVTVNVNVVGFAQKILFPVLTNFQGFDDHL